MGVEIMRKEHFDELARGVGNHTKEVAINFFWIVYRLGCVFLLLIALYKFFFIYDGLQNVFGLACDKYVTLATVPKMMWAWLFGAIISFAAMGANRYSHLPPQDPEEEVTEVPAFQREDGKKPNE